MIRLRVSPRYDFRGAVANKLIDLHNSREGHTEGDWFADVIQGNLFHISPGCPPTWDPGRDSQIVHIKYLVPARMRLKLEPPMRQQIAALPWDVVQQHYWNSAPIGEIYQPCTVRSVLNWAKANNPDWAATISNITRQREHKIRRLAQQAILDTIPISYTVGWDKEQQQKQQIA